MFVPRLRLILPLTAAISLLSLSCGESKVTQCNKLILTINQADIVTEGAKTGEPAALLEAAEGLERLAGELVVVEVEDKHLQRLRSRFVQMYRTLGQILRNTVVALEKKDRQGVENARQFLQQAHRQDVALVQELNRYCGGD